MAFARNTPVVAANDHKSPPNIGLIAGQRPSHRIMTLDPRESEEIEMYVVAWLVGGQLAYTEVPGVNLRRATKEELRAFTEASRSEG
jgi:hypothetical protein